MIIIIIILLITIGLFMSGCLNESTISKTITPTSTSRQYNNMTHEEFTQAVKPPKGVTQLQMQDFYNGLDRLSSQYVTWRLQVEDVTSDSVQLRVDSSSMGIKKVVLYVTEDQKSKLHSLNKGEYITVEGRPNARKTILNAIVYQESGSPSNYLLLLVELTDGKIISKG